MKKIYLFLFLATLFILNVGVIGVFAQYDGVVGDLLNDTVNVGATNINNSVSPTIQTSAQDDEDEPSKVDANGNLTIKTGETYNSAINLGKGNLTVKSGASVKEIRVESGNVVLEDGVDVNGSITINRGNLTVGSNVDISGNVKVGGSATFKDNDDIKGGISANTLSAGNNFDVVGFVTVASSNSVIYIGSNSDIKNTLTSKSGLQIGSNSDVKLFLSGESVEIEGKVYKLGGKIIKSGTNTSVGLPFVPKAREGVEIKTIPASETAKETAKEEVKESDVNGEEGEQEDEENDFYSGLAPLPDIDDIVDIGDVDSYVKKVSGIDTNISDLNLSPENVDLDYNVPALLFGFIPMPIEANINVSKDKDVDVAFPWYSFLFSTPVKKQVIKENIVSAVENSFNSNIDNAGSAGIISSKMQAFITNSVLSVFKNMFGGE